ncbi:MAG: hypothetical protein GXO65_00845 [Euryarchaeota archaeon]|nr:hypothetical protein [Euryarchaeota archaeon]
MTHLVPLEIVGKHLLIKPITLQYPEEKPVISERFRGLHHLDLDQCIGCGTCARQCPNKCITMFVAGVEEKKIGEKVVKVSPDIHRQVHVLRPVPGGLPKGRSRAYQDIRACGLLQGGHALHLRTAGGRW